MMTAESDRRHKLWQSLIDRAIERAQQRGHTYTDADELLRMCGLFEWAPQHRQARQYANKMLTSLPNEKP